jgi:hypothetical protein
VLKISEPQLEAMGDVLVEAFHERLFLFARRDLPEYTGHLDDAALRARIREDAEAAQALGMMSNRAVTQFVGFSLISSRVERFYRRPEFVELLAPPDSELKLDVFLRRLGIYFEQKGI